MISLKSRKVSPHAVEEAPVLAKDRIVTSMPLAELWDENGTLNAERIRNLDKAALTELLRQRPVPIVVADCGFQLQWIPSQECFQFWQSLRPQIADPLKPIFLNEFPNEVAYIASEWLGQNGESLILLEVHH